MMDCVLKKNVYSMDENDDDDDVLFMVTIDVNTNRMEK
jgi:hypothetical protein